MSQNPSEQAGVAVTLYTTGSQPVYRGTPVCICSPSASLWREQRLYGAKLEISNLHTSNIKGEEANQYIKILHKLSITII
jgi:hypothetical protein